MLSLTSCGNFEPAGVEQLPPFQVPLIQPQLLIVTVTVGFVRLAPVNSTWPPNSAAWVAWKATLGTFPTDAAGVLSQTVEAAALAPVATIAEMAVAARTAEASFAALPARVRVRGMHARIFALIKCVTSY
jgi:hypothetical protein